MHNQEKGIARARRGGHIESHRQKIAPAFSAYSQSMDI